MQVLLRLRGSVIPKALVWSVPCAAVTVFLHLYWNAEKGEANNEMEGISTIWSGFTFVLGFLIVFRSNQAYSRFWESVTLFYQIEGEWTSAFSNILAFCSADPDKRIQVDEFRHSSSSVEVPSSNQPKLSIKETHSCSCRYVEHLLLVVDLLILSHCARQYLTRLMSLLHCSALQTTCELDDDSLEVLDIGAISSEGLVHFRDSPDRCETVLLWLERLVVDAERSKLLEAPPPILSRAFQELSRGMVSMTNLKKIRDVPFPFPYSQFLSYMLLAHWILFPLVASQTVLKPWWAGIIVFVVETSNWTLFYIAQEIDQPFGEDANDLPVRDMQRKFNAKLDFFIQPGSYTVPSVNLEASKHICLLRSTFSVAASRTNTSMLDHAPQQPRVRAARSEADALDVDPNLDESCDSNTSESAVVHVSSAAPMMSSMAAVAKSEALTSLGSDEQELLDRALLEQLVSQLLPSAEHIPLPAADAGGAGAPQFNASSETQPTLSLDLLEDLAKRLDEALFADTGPQTAQNECGLSANQLISLRHAISQALGRMRSL